MGDFLLGFQNALSPLNLLYCFIGALLGTVVGVLPGLGPTATMAMLLPMTAYLDPTGAIIMLAGIFYGAMYGGSVTSILLNVPGEASSVLTAIDGYQMTKQGRGGETLAIAAIGSFIAGTVAIHRAATLRTTPGRSRLEIRGSRICGVDVVLLYHSDSCIGEKQVARRISGNFRNVDRQHWTRPHVGKAKACFGSITLMKWFDVVPVLLGFFWHSRNSFQRQ